MPRMPLHGAVGTLLVVALCVQARSAMAQTPAHIRVAGGPAPIQRWLHAPSADVVLELQPGTTLEVLDEDTGWYWVVLPPDVHGTRKVGWIHVSHVARVAAESVTANAAATTAAHGNADEPGQPERVSPSASHGTPSTGDDTVTVVERRDGTVAARAAPKAYTFADVHFDRDRYALRQEDMDILRAVSAALKADPALVVNIEGHTCNVGTMAYNLALAARRAEAVKNYLVSEGVAAERLHTVSLGEQDAKHDNSREETRRLNRRVAIVQDERP